MCYNKFGDDMSILARLNNGFDDVTLNVIMILVIAICIYIVLYVPIKLYQINKNTKAIKEELEKLNDKIKY